MNITPILACALSPEQIAQRREALLPSLFNQADTIDDLPNGLRLRFAYRAGLLAKLASVIEEENQCCSFLRFQISIEPDSGPIAFEVTGPEGAREMLLSLQ